VILFGVVAVLTDEFRYYLHVLVFVFINMLVRCWEFLFFLFYCHCICVDGANVGVGVKGSRPGRTGVTRLPRGDNGGLRGAPAILQGR